ncbi:MAG: DUF3800 domain-containing protein [Clostridiales bacterium]|nr:DUF3800 domain-containing protein [Clostridiales bacterium]
MTKKTKLLSCFIDETGDFGDYDTHCPFYIVTAVLHDQSISITDQLNGLETYLSNLGYPHHAIHAGPLIRRESDYENLTMEERKKMFNLLYNFTRKIPVNYICAKVKKSNCRDADDLDAKLTKAIKAAVLKSKEYWDDFDKIIIYYDNGQNALKRVLNITFNSLFSDVEVRKIQPSDYRLFQIADLICTLELTASKIEFGSFSNTELQFFHGSHEFKKEYYRKIKKKEL